jgi:hypothetical protein
MKGIAFRSDFRLTPAFDRYNSTLFTVPQVVDPNPHFYWLMRSDDLSSLNLSFCYRPSELPSLIPRSFPLNWRSTFFYAFALGVSGAIHQTPPYLRSRFWMTAGGHKKIDLGRGLLKTTSCLVYPICHLVSAITSNLPLPPYSGPLHPRFRWSGPRNEVPWPQLVIYRS